MDPELRAALRRGRGVVAWAELAESVPRWAVDNACRSGSLVRVLPGVYADPGRDVRHRAALIYAGPPAVLSHGSALAVWGLPDEASAEPVHVTVDRRCSARSRAGVVVHRLGDRPPGIARRGLAVTRLERTLVDAWATLDGAERHDPVIRAVGGRLTTPERLATALAGTPRGADRAQLRRLVDRLAAGCRSQLEIWGHDHVFRGLPMLRRQHPFHLGDRTIYLDVYAEAAGVAFELDGAAYHGDPVQRERDLRRDAELFARHRVTTVRYSHRRLLSEPEAVRREVRAMLRVTRPVGKRPGPTGQVT